MRIQRAPNGWRILSPECSRGLCLKAVAGRGGYRVREICGELGCSEAYFRRVFLRDTGLSPKQWLRDERMLIARQRIREGRDALEVAEMLGFSGPASFRREFRAVFGMLPARMAGRSGGGR